MLKTLFFPYAARLWESAKILKYYLKVVEMNVERFLKDFLEIFRISTFPDCINSFSTAFQQPVSPSFEKALLTVYLLDKLVDLYIDHRIRGYLLLDQIL